MISACTNRYINSVDPFIWVGADERRALFLFDGTYSWGSGAEAAAWYRNEITSRFASQTTLNSKMISDELETLAPPLSITSEYWDWDFSIAVALVEADVIQLGLIGIFSAVLLRGPNLIRLFTPRRLVDQLIEAGEISAEDAERHDYRKVTVCTSFCQTQRSLNWLEPFQLLPSDKLLLGDTALPHLLGLKWLTPSSNPESLRDEIERLGGHNSPTAIIEGISDSIP